jgi:carboxypeptidase T
MKFIKLITPALLFIALFSPSFAQHPDGIYSRLKVYADPAAQLRMAGAGVDFDHLSFSGKTHIIGEFSEWEKSQIEKLGLSFEVLVADLETFYAENLRHSPAAKTNDVNAAPNAFNYGSMGSYLTYSEALDELDSMLLNFPSLVTAKASIGTTIEGRTMWMVKISDNPNVDESEPEVLYDALHHAREPMALMQMIYYMQYLLENYGTNAEVTYLVNNREMFFVPIVNPDGYVYNETTNPGGGGMWRKNRRNNGNGTYGVDINRNYGHFWAYDTIGSSPTPSSDRYCGPSAFSEPETQNMRDFCNARQFKTALNYHSFGNLLIYPWGWLPSYYTPDSNLYFTFAQILTDENGYTAGTGNETVNYTTNGSADDWMYGEQITKGKIMSLTPEVGDQAEFFWPQQQFILPWCDINLRPNLEIAWLAGDYLFVEEMIAEEVEGTTVFLPADWTNAGLISSNATTATFIDIDPNVVSVNTSVTLPALATSNTHVDSFSVTLAGGIADGTEITGIIRTQYAGGYTQDDTVSFVYGIPDIIHSDSAEIVPVQWTGGWNSTGERAHTGNNSFTDSPLSFYDDFDFNEFETQTAIDLAGYTLPKLKFWALWDIEAGYDYCQVSISGNGSNWIPLEGIYSHPGSGDQPPGEPIYDGNQSTWVQEIIDLTPWAGQSIDLKFLLGADPYYTLDGFYFDDMVITGYPIGSGINNDEWVDQLYLYPNPSAGTFQVNGWGLHKGEAVILEIFTIEGAKVLEQNLTNEVVDGSTLSQGVYLCRFLTESEGSSMKKWILAR